MTGHLASSTATVITVGFAVSAIVTPIVRAVARAMGAVAQPKSDRWHSKPTAMFGGIGIFAAVMAATILVVPHSSDRWAVIAASTALFVIGLIDDIFHIKPYQKLIGQMLGAAMVVDLGLVLPWTGSSLFNMMITFVWLIGITNAVNMLDNMDGLATGVSAIAAFFLAMNFYSNGQTGEALMLCGFGGALLGFLVYNHNPASIFMGDCGSMFVGFFLSGSALLAGSGGGRSRSVMAVLAVPVLVLLIPIFDTTFVTLMRKLAGRAASQGGRDHTSHRLVALGLSERAAVWMLYAFALLAGTLAIVVRRVPLDVSVAAIAAFVIVLTFLGVYLGRVRVYDEGEIAAAREKPMVSFLIDLSYKRRLFEVALDFVLIVLSYYCAYLMVFGPATDSGDWQLFGRTLPVIVFIKLATFLSMGLYRGIWRYASMSSAIAIARAVLLSSVLCVLAIVLAFRFEGYSRTVFVLDAFFLLSLVTASRFAFRIMRRMIPTPHARAGKRVLIYGAGDGGELLLRELHNNSQRQYTPVAFYDDDARKAGRLIDGLRVYSGAVPLAEICSRLRVDEVLLSTERISLNRLAMIVGECAAAGLSVTRAYMSFQPLAASDYGWVMSTDATGAAPPITRHDVSIIHPPRPTATDH